MSPPSPSSSLSSTATTTSTPYQFKLPSSASSSKFPPPPPFEAPPSDDEQEDYINYDDDDEEYMDYMQQEQEQHQNDQHPTEPDMHAAPRKCIIKREQLETLRDSAFQSFIQSKSGNDLVKFSSSRGGKDIMLRFDAHLENALRALGIMETLRGDLIVARKNKDKRVVTLQRSENAWVPGAFSTHVNTPEKVRSEMTDILNKMTPEKYDRLFRKFWNIQGVQDPDNIKVMVRCIQEKALFEPNFSNVYAKLCRDIIDERNYSKKEEFKALLLRETQQEFEKERKDISNKNPEYMDKTQEDIEHLKAQAKRRALGNIRFIGELYKQKILAERIIHQVVRDLLLMKDTPDPEEIEVLCALLATVGKSLDETKKEFMDVYFKRLQKLTESPKLRTRIIFMIENIIELRQDDWVPRIKEEKAQKLKQVLMNHANEEQEKKNELREKRLSRKMQR